jgi:hypothetical protein
MLIETESLRLSPTKCLFEGAHHGGVQLSIYLVGMEWDGACAHEAMWLVGRCDDNLPRTSVNLLAVVEATSSSASSTC